MGMDMLEGDLYSQNTVSELSNYIFTSKYSQYREDLKRRETWDECVDRVADMHLRKFSYLPKTDLYEIKKAFELVRAKKVLPSARSLQYAGKAVEKNNVRIFNCATRHIDSIEAFGEYFFMLLSGCGVGVGITKRHLNKLPAFAPRARGIKVIQIEDSIEGWADSIKDLLHGYLTSGLSIHFDYSKIRPKGSPLKTSGGVAPGPDGLKAAHEKIKTILERASGTSERLSTIDCYDILMHVADAVLSGGVRRSAVLVAFDRDDDLMMKAKTGNWFEENPQRARSNNSVVLVRNKVQQNDIEEFIEHTRSHGEPGYIFADDKEALFNPCVTANGLVVTATGVQTVKDLIAVPYFKALVDGEVFPSTEVGFFQTGIQDTIILELSSGLEIELTGNHKLLNGVGNWQEAGDFEIGDFIRVSDHSSFNIHVNKESTDYAQGYLLGSLIGDGNQTGDGRAELKFWGNKNEEYRQIVYGLISQAGWLSAKHKAVGESTDKAVISSTKLFDFATSLGCFEGNKHLSHQAESGSWDYLSGLVCGYFDADGTVADNFKSGKGNSVRLASSQLDNLKAVQRILNAFGIFSRVYKNRRPAGLRQLPDGQGGLKEYWCEANHELVISSGNMERFSQLIGFKNVDKQAKLNNLLNSYQRDFNVTHFIDVVADIRKGTSQPVYDCSVPNENAFSINGFYAHNCGEAGFIPILENGDCGAQFCNLTTINGTAVETEEHLIDYAKAAALIGTLQATYTDFPYLSEASKQLTEEEALLGVSILGILSNPLLYSPQAQRRASEAVVETNKVWAKKLGINQAARCTLVKPDGQSALLLGSMYSGIHPAHARKMFRRVQVNRTDPVYQYFRQHNPALCEPSIWSANDTDDIICFPVRLPNSAKVKSGLTAVEHLDIIRSTQENWVNPGKTDANHKSVSHSVSCTVMVGEDEWADVAEYLYANRDYFSSVSLVPKTTDKLYKQAPMEQVSTVEEHNRFEELQSVIMPVDYSKMYEQQDNTVRQESFACYAGACELSYA